MRILRGLQHQLIALQNVDETGIRVHNGCSKIYDSPQYSPQRTGGSHPAPDFVQEIQWRVLMLFAENLSRALSGFPDKQTHFRASGLQVSVQSHGSQAL